MKQSLSKLSLRLLARKIILIKSSAFLKIVLTAQNSSEIQSISIDNKQKSFFDLVQHFLEKQEFKQKKDAFQNIKQAGWKLIPQVHSSDEEDSLNDTFIDFKRSIIESVFQSQKEDNFYDTKSLNKAEQNMPFRLNYIQSIKTSPSTHYQTSRAQLSTINRVNKRKVILSKLQSLSCCVQYLQTSVFYYR